MNLCKMPPRRPRSLWSVTQRSPCSEANCRLFWAFLNLAPGWGRKGTAGAHLLRPEQRGECARLCVHACVGGVSPPQLPDPSGPPRAPRARGYRARAQQPPARCLCLKPLSRLWPPGRARVAAARAPNCRAWLGLLGCPLRAVSPSYLSLQQLLSSTYCVWPDPVAGVHSAVAPPCPPVSRRSGSLS